MTTNTTTTNNNLPDFQWLGTNNIKAVRDKMHLTNEEFAQLFKVSRRAVEHWLHDNRRPSEDNMRKIYALYRLHVKGDTRYALSQITTQTNTTTPKVRKTTKVTVLTTDPVDAVLADTEDFEKFLQARMARNVVEYISKKSRMTPVKVANVIAQYIALSESPESSEAQIRDILAAVTE